MSSILKFGKFKGQDFYKTPLYYQKWLLKQDWFKLPTNKVKEVKYDVVRLLEYPIRGISREIVEYNLSWEDAVKQKDLMNLYHLDDCTKSYYIEKSRY
jgi:hypothetical protein